MPRGRRTNLVQAVLARVLAEMGFEPWEIASLTGLPRRTVTDIAHGKGTWSATTGPENELVDIIRLRVIETIDSVAYGLALKAMAKLNQRMDTASSLELINYAGRLGAFAARRSGELQRQ
jgi:hypothetical protein